MTSSAVEQELPFGWTRVSICDIADVRSSNVDKKIGPGEDLVLLCNYMDVYANDVVDDRIDFMVAGATRAEVERFGLQDGDVLITKDSETPNDIAVPALVRGSLSAPVVCGYHLAILRPTRGRAAGEFLAFLLRTPRGNAHFRKSANGSTRYGLTLGAIAAAPVVLPPLPEQRRISEILDALDETIRKTEQVIAKLQQMKRGLLHDLLTRGIDENGELRNPERHPEQFKDSSLGRIPASWKVARLLDLVELPSGQVDPRWEPYSSWVLVAPDHIQPGTGRLLKTSTAAEQGAISGKYGFLPGDVIYSKIRPYLRKAVVADREGLCSADMYPLRPTPAMNPRFLLALILGERFSRFAAGVSMRSGFPKINREELGEYVMAYPSRQEQDALSQSLVSVDIREDCESRQLDKLRALKQGLMDDLLTGRVPVSTPEAGRA